MRIPIILYLIFLMILSSCSNCEDSSEPTLTVFCENGEYYNIVYGIGGHDTLDMTNELPLAINSDTTIYLFINSHNTTTDTLGITYKRTIEYHSEICGFTIELDSFKMLETSSFDSAYFTIYEQTHTGFGTDNKNIYEVFLFD